MSKDKIQDAKSEAEIAAEIAEEARAQADEAAEQAVEAVAEVEKLNAKEAEDALTAARKEVDKRKDAVTKAQAALKEAIAKCDTCIETLDAIRPPLSTMELIQKHNAEMNERRKAGTVINPIDQAGSRGASPFQL